MPTHSLHARGWRDGFWGREPREADETYLEGYEAGYRAGDRTRLVAGHVEPSPSTCGHVSDSSHDASGGVANLTTTGGLAFDVDSTTTGGQVDHHGWSE